MSVDFRGCPAPLVFHDYGHNRVHKDGLRSGRFQAGQGKEKDNQKDKVPRDPADAAGGVQEAGRPEEKQGGEGRKKEEQKMRVTTMMRDHIRDLVMKKVQDRLAKAEKAHDDQETKDKQALDAVREYAASLIPAMTEKVVAFAKKQGLTMFKHPWNRLSGEKEDEDPNYAFLVAVDDDDFEETNTYSTNKSPERKMRQELKEEPKRIRQAVEKAANAIVFSLELGKVKKAELEKLIESTEVEL